MRDKPTRFKIFIQYSLIGLIVAVIGTYVRLYPLYNFTSTDISEKTTLLILSQVRSKIASQVQQQQPLASPQEKALLTKKLFDEVIREEGQNLRKAIDAASLEIQKNSDAAAQRPYLLASDSFYYYKLTQNIETKGAISDTVKGSKYLNKLMLAPKGHWEPLNLHPYIGYFVYKTQKIFNPSVDMMQAVSFTPLIIAALCLIPFLFICYKLHCQPLVSFISALFFFLAPIFVKRSTFGWYDNDPYSTLFPLCILACFFQGLTYLKKSPPLKGLPLSAKADRTNTGSYPVPRRKVFGAATFTALFMLLYSLFWQGWVFLFAVIFISSVLIIIHNLLFGRFLYDIKKLWQYLLGICLGGFLLISIVFGINEFFVLFVEGWKALKNFMAPQLSLWPDIYISVSELHKGSLSYIIEHTGGIFFFCVALIGWLRYIFRQKRPDQRDVLYETIVIGVFFVMSFMITLGAQRFVLLCLIPLSLMFALGVQFLAQTLFSLSHKKFQYKGKIERTVNAIIITLFLLGSAIPYIRIQNSIQSLLNPIYNDTWHKILTTIREKTPSNSIINTWWPPGHFIKATAHRAVTFDGATINFPQAYWMANVFLSESETEALGLIRMLNNSGNDAADYLHKELGLPLSISVQALKEITRKSRNEARTLLQKGFDSSTATHILSLTHSKPPPSYCLVYKEFVDANLQLGFFGKWNFRSIEEINKNPQLLKKVPSANSKEYVDFIWNLVGGPFKYSSPLGLISENENKLLFDGNVTIDKTTKACRVLSDKYGKGTPQNIFYMENGLFTEKTFPEANLPFSVVLYRQEKNYNIILLDERLAKSLLIRLYFFEGQGLRYFKLFDEESDLTGRNKIYVYEIDWDKFIQEL